MIWRKWLMWLIELICEWSRTIFFAIHTHLDDTSFYGDLMVFRRRKSAMDQTREKNYRENIEIQFGSRKKKKLDDKMLKLCINFKFLRNCFDIKNLNLPQGSCCKKKTCWICHTKSKSMQQISRLFITIYYLRVVVFFVHIKKRYQVTVWVYFFTQLSDWIPRKKHSCV